MYCPKGACCVTKAENEIGIHNTTYTLGIKVKYENAQKYLRRHSIMIGKKNEC